MNPGVGGGKGLRSQIARSQTARSQTARSRPVRSQTARSQVVQDGEPAGGVPGEKAVGLPPGCGVGLLISLAAVGPGQVIEVMVGELE